MKNENKVVWLLIPLVLFIQSCGDDQDSGIKTREFGIFTVQPDNTTVLSDGDINTRTLSDFNKMIEAFPNINLINIKEMPGSLDDETNVQIGPKIYNGNIDIHVLDGGLIASGGVDFFLAGKKRTLGNNVMVGVHSWATDQNTATDFPEDSPEHDLFINYYKAIGLSDQLARDFYFFTINAAAANDIHYMTDAEIEQFEMER